MKILPQAFTTTFSQEKKKAKNKQTKTKTKADEYLSLSNIAFQLSSGHNTCSVLTGINDECTPTRKGIGALKKKKRCKVIIH